MECLILCMRNSLGWLETWLAQNTLIYLDKYKSVSCSKVIQGI